MAGQDAKLSVSASSTSVEADTEISTHSNKGQAHLQITAGGIASDKYGFGTTTNEANQKNGAARLLLEATDNLATSDAELYVETKSTDVGANAEGTIKAHAGKASLDVVATGTGGDAAADATLNVQTSSVHGTADATGTFTSHAGTASLAVTATGTGGTLGGTLDAADATLTITASSLDEDADASGTIISHAGKASLDLTATGTGNNAKADATLAVATTSTDTGADATGAFTSHAGLARLTVKSTGTGNGATADATLTVETDSTNSDAAATATVDSAGGAASMTVTSASVAVATAANDAATGSGNNFVDITATCASLGFSDGDLVVYAKGAGADLTCNGGACAGSYYLRDVSASKFKLASSPGGTAITLGGGANTNTFTGGEDASLTVSQTSTTGHGNTAVTMKSKSGAATMVLKAEGTQNLAGQDATFTVEAASTNTGAIQ
jgi:hypothetical protein